ncbi:MAG: 2-octaprenyl-6-methoxyphenyl hydroxylase [Halioglobus sp.]|nr:2-octaprenyl-6-methoxyphenyl hydroxylase [Halioglobus sp.]
MADDYDIVVAGGGMVGISLALRLGATLPATTRILLVEGFALPEPGTGQAPTYHPSFDARSTALSYGSRLIYEDMGVWSELAPGLCSIDTIHVSSRGHFGSAVLAAGDYDWPALGYVVENAHMGAALVQALYHQGRVAILSPARATGVELGENAVELALEHAETPRVRTRLVVVADGAESGLRDLLGVAVAAKSYEQHALIANVATAESHGGCAFERFTDEGPLALLPLNDIDGRHRSALVWTLPPERAEELKMASDEAFLAALQARFGYRLGRVREVGERHTYPLSLVTSEEQVRQGLVVMGNAAHALHPVAGQGFNLALRDVAGLATALAQGLAAGRAPGELTVLRAYQQSQQRDQERTIGFSDRVPDLFMQGDPVLGLGRDLALAGLDVMPGLKREFVRFAAGVADMAVAARG